MENLREIINGSLLQMFNGKKVSVTGLVTSSQANGLSFEMRTLDDVAVKVIVKKPNKEPLQGLVEVHGVANGNSINCEEIIQFKEADEPENKFRKARKQQPFNPANHNKLCELLQNSKTLWEIK